MSDTLDILKTHTTVCDLASDRNGKYRINLFSIVKFDPVVSGTFTVNVRDKSNHIVRSWDHDNLADAVKWFDTLVNFGVTQDDMY